MNNEELVERATRYTIQAMESVRPIVIHGIKLIDTDRNIIKGTQFFIFENGWTFEPDINRLYHKGGPDAIYEWLVNEIESRLSLLGLELTQLEAFNAPEVLQDEDPSELDPDPVFVCDRCRRYYEYDKTI